MEKITYKKRFLFGAFLAAAMIIGSAAFAPKTYAEDKLYLMISPVSETLELDPGQTYSGKMRVMNSGDKAFDYKLYVEPYYVSDGDYTPNFGEKNDRTKITEWFNLSRDGGSLEPGGQDWVDYTIKVPSDAAGGGQYAAIIAEGENEDRALIKTSTRVAEIFFTNIGGESTSCVKIISNSINRFMFEPPVNALSTVEDCGNTHVEASYTMKVYSLFSDKEIYSNEEDPETHTILPETKRFNTTSWTKEQGAPMMGIYTVEHTVKIGKESDTIKKIVFIFPLWLVIILLLFLGSLIFWLVSRARARKEAAKESRPRDRDED